MDVTLSALFTDYEKYHRAKARTHEKADRAFAHLIAFAGDLPAARLGPGRLNRWSSWLATEAPNARTQRKGLRRHTVKTTVGAAAQVFAWACRQRDVDGRNDYELTVNPFTLMEPVKVDRRAVRYYTVGEARDILHAAAELRWRNDPTKTLAWYTAILMGLQAGLRKNECTNLRWRDIDLQAGRISVTHRDDCPGDCWAWSSKGAHEDTVPMGDELWAALIRLREIRPWTYPIIPKRRLDALMSRPWPLPEKVRDNPVWNWSRDFQRIMRTANRARRERGDEPIRPGDFHTLRKSLGTWLAERGVPEHYVQLALRHQSPDTTRQHYVGVNRRACEQAVRDTVNALSLSS